MTLTLPSWHPIEKLVPGSPEWLTQPYVNASYAGVLFGCHTYVTVQQLAAMRRGEHRDDAGEAAETGNEMEPWIAERWATREGVTVYVPEATYVAGPLSANPDRLIVGCTDTILQVKATTKTEGPVPSSHWWQVQAEMACTGADKAVLAYFFGGSLCCREHIVGRDDEAIATLIEAAEQFLACLDLDMDPPVVEREAVAERVVEAGAAEAAEVEAFLRWRQIEKDAGKEVAKLRPTIDALFGGPGMVPGERLRVQHDGKPLVRLRRQRGRAKLVPDPSGERHEDVTVIEEAK